VTVHDLIPILYPEHFPKGIRGGIKWRIQKYSLKRKQRIITDSESSKKDIEKIIGIGKQTIDVIYLAPSLPNATVSINYVELMERYNLHGAYFLYVGDVNWNKNVFGLLKAFSQYLVHHKSIIQLVLVGGAFLDTTLKETQEINRLCSQLNIDGNVVRTGYVSDDDLVGLYRHATALIQPSFAEGFGLPVLEAMLYGCPVISSTTSSLQEIMGPSLRIDPNDQRSLTSVMSTASSMKPSARNELIRKGKEWVHTFTWEKVASDTVRSYEKVLANQ